MIALHGESMIGGNGGSWKPLSGIVAMIEHLHRGCMMKQPGGCYGRIAEP